MTKEERKKVIEVFDDMKVKIDIPKAAKTQNDRNWALDLAIQVLSQEPCETCGYAEGSPFCLQYCPYDAERKKEQKPCDNAVSRERALAPYKDLNDDDVISVWLIKKNITELPSVTQDEQLYKNGFADGYEQGHKDAEQKSGKWIDREEYDADRWKCSVCGRTEQYKENYCPNCDAKMESEDAE